MKLRASVGVCVSLSLFAIVGCSRKENLRAADQKVNLSLEAITAPLQLADATAKFWPVHAGIRVSKNGTVVFQGQVQGNTDIELPQGDLNYEFMVYGLRAPEGSPGKAEFCGPNKNLTSASKFSLADLPQKAPEFEGPEKIFVTSKSGVWKIGATTAEVSIELPPLQMRFMPLVGLQFSQDFLPLLGGNSSQARVRVKSELSGKPVLDPCDGAPLGMRISEQGRAVSRFPLLDGIFTSQLSIESSSFSKQFDGFAASSNPQEFERNLFSLSVDGKVRQQTETEDFDNDGLINGAEIADAAEHSMVSKTAPNTPPNTPPGGGAGGSVSNVAMINFVGGSSFLDKEVLAPSVLKQVSLKNNSVTNSLTVRNVNFDGPNIMFADEFNLESNPPLDTQNCSKINGFYVLASLQECFVYIKYEPKKIGQKNVPVKFDFLEASGNMVSMQLQLFARVIPTKIASHYAGLGKWTTHVQLPNNSDALKLDAYEMNMQKVPVVCNVTSPVFDQERNRGCVHAGEIKSVNTGLANCDGLQATDSLGVFEWGCRVYTKSSGTAPLAYVISTGFKPGKGLRDLIDWTGAMGPVKKQMSVSILKRDLSGLTLPGFPVASLPSEVLESSDSLNSSLLSGSPSSPNYVAISAPGIYLVTQNYMLDSLSISADNVTLVTAPNVKLSSSIANSATQCESGARGQVCMVESDFGWIEASFESTNATVLDRHQFGVAVRGTNFTRVHRSKFVGHHLSGVKIFDTSSNVKSYNTTVSDSIVEGVASAAYSVGILVSNSLHTKVFSNEILSSKEVGIYTASAHNTTFARNSVKDSNVGIFMEHSNGFVAEGNNVKLLTTSNASALKVKTLSVTQKAVLARNTLRNGPIGIEWNGNQLQAINNLAVQSSVYGMQTKGFNQTSCTDDVNFASGGLVYNFGFLGSAASKAVQDCTGLAAIPAAQRSKYGGKFARNISKINIGGLDDILGSELLSDLTPSLGHMRFSSLGSSFMNFSSTVGNATSTNLSDYFVDDSAFRLEPNLQASGFGNILQNVPNFQREIDGSCSTAIRQNLSTIFLQDNSPMVPNPFLSHYHNAQEILNDMIGNENGLCEAGEECLFAPYIGEFQVPAASFERCEIQDGMAGRTVVFSK